MASIGKPTRVVTYPEPILAPVFTPPQRVETREVEERELVPAGPKQVPVKREQKW